VAAFASSFIKTGTASTERNTTKEVLNCIRILQRVLPVVFEVEGESSVFEVEVLWKQQVDEEDGEEKEEAGAPQFVIEDDGDSENDEERARSPPPTNTKPKHKKKLPSLCERLFSCIIDLLFCCGFTLPSTVQVDHYKINYIIWYVVTITPTSRAVY
jgi:hypothetical protein